jgi:hypothetical protein
MKIDNPIRKKLNTAMKSIIFEQKNNVNLLGSFLGHNKKLEEKQSKQGKALLIVV